MANVVITFAAKTRDLLKGLRGVERGVDEIAEELDTAQRESDRFEDAFKDAMRGAERAADKTARSAGQDFDKLSDGLGDVGKEGAGEFKQNLAQGLSSGNLEDIVQDTLGGVTAGLKGGVGGAAAVLAGLGALAFQQVREEAERMAAWAESWAEGFRDQVNQARDALKQEDIQAGFEQWLADNEASFLKIHGDLETLNIDAHEFAQYLYAGGDASDFLLQQIEAARSGGTDLVDIAGRVRPQYDDAAKAAGRIQTEILGLDREQDKVVETQQKMADFYGEDMVDGVLNLRQVWAGFEKETAKPIYKKVIIQTEVHGDGRAYIDPPATGSGSPSRSATNNIHSNQVR